MTHQTEALAENKIEWMEKAIDLAIKWADLRSDDSPTADVVGAFNEMREHFLAALSSQPPAPIEPVAWQWRKRILFSTKDRIYCWSEWEPLVPPYMDARGLANTDPENYELRALCLCASLTATAGSTP